MDLLAQLAEAKIDEAIACGELTPPPSGTTLDLEAYFASPEEWRSVFSLLRGHGFLPPEVEGLKEIETLERRQFEAEDMEERKELAREMESRRVAFQMALERCRMGRGGA